MLEADRANVTFGCVCRVMTMREGMMAQTINPAHFCPCSFAFFVCSNNNLSIYYSVHRTAGPSWYFIHEIIHT